MICQLCATNPINTELQTLCKRPVCLSCGTAIAAALPLLKTQPCRRQTICMRLGELGLSVMSTRQEVRELVDWGVSDEQLRGACDIAKERNAFNFGYVYGVLKNERERTTKAAEVPAAVEPPSPVRAKEDWERLGFANQADYEAWQWSYDSASRRGNRISEAESRRIWQASAP